VSSHEHADKGETDNGELQIKPAIIRQAVLNMLATRSRSATICPSEVARSLASQNDYPKTSDWRDLMSDVHDAVDALVAEDTVQLSWKGKPMTARSGPYRVGRNTDASAR
jgi:hypothetical protein